FSLCYQNLGDLAQAVTYLERYLAEAADVPNRANLEIRLRNLRDRVAATPPPAEPQVTAPVATPEPAPVPPPVAVAATGDGTNGGAILGFSIAAVGLAMVGVFGGLTLATDSSLQS